jgi:hypothetical protein
MAFRFEAGVGKVNFFAFGQRRQNGFAIGEDGLPDLAQLTLIQDQIRAAQLADRR